MRCIRAVGAAVCNMPHAASPLCATGVTRPIRRQFRAMLQGERIANMYAKHSLPAPLHRPVPPHATRRDPKTAPPWRFTDWAAI